jgi:hypothetical protein
MWSLKPQPAGVSVDVGVGVGVASAPYLAVRAGAPEATPEEEEECCRLSGRNSRKSVP